MARRSSGRLVASLSVVVTCTLLTPVSAAQDSSRSGAEIYRGACAACHGDDGRGMPRAVVGFETPLPDFTDCGFTTSEANFDWNAVVHLGGLARALDRRMPAFGEALSRDEIQRAIDYIRGFCTSRAWPHGDLNLPRPLTTEKAFPENEAYVRLSEPFEGYIENRFVFEGRLGARSEIELALPFSLTHVFGAWQRGIGDIGV